MRFWDSLAGRWLGICMSISLVLLALFGGIGLVQVMTGPSWAEICVSQGGEYNINSPDTDESREWCDMP